MARLNFKVELENGGALGPGKIRLLEYIEQKGSIRRAAAAMGMSYRRAWLLLHEVEDMMGASVFAPETGGRKGGGTALTAVGRAIVGHYRSIEAGAERAIAPDLRALSRLAKPRSLSAKRKRGTKTKR
jgi:molybdate transport system regulatory protein